MDHQTLKVRLQTILLAFLVFAILFLSSSPIHQKALA